MQLADLASPFGLVLTFLIFNFSDMLPVYEDKVWDLQLGMPLPDVFPNGKLTVMIKAKKLKLRRKISCTD